MTKIIPGFDIDAFVPVYMTDEFIQWAFRFLMSQGKEQKDIKVGDIYELFDVVGSTLLSADGRPGSVPTQAYEDAHRAYCEDWEAYCKERDGQERPPSPFATSE